MVDFFSQFGRIKTPEDYRRVKEQFELDKRLKQDQIASAQAERDFTKQKMEYQLQNPTSNAPATLQVNAAIQKALDAGDYDTANRIAWLQRSQAYGIDTFSPQGNTPESFQPFKPKPSPTQQPAQQPTQQPERPMGQGIVPNYDKPEYVPTGQSILGGGSSITQQLVNKAALESGAKERAKLEEQLNYVSPIKEAESYGAAAGKERLEREKREKVQAKVTNRLAQMAQYYNQLSDLGAIVDPSKSAMENIGARIGSSSIGQAIGGAVGSKAQNVRYKIEQMRPTLMSDIRQATEMGAKGLDSEKELEFYLQAVSDPRRPLGANMAALKVLDEAYGLGASDIAATPEDIEKLKREFLQQTSTSKSGARREMDRMQDDFKNKNDINELLDMYAPK